MLAACEHARAVTLGPANVAPSASPSQRNVSHAPASLDCLHYAVLPSEQTATRGQASEQ